MLQLATSRDCVKNYRRDRSWRQNTGVPSQARAVPTVAAVSALQCVVLAYQSVVVRRPRHDSKSSMIVDRRDILQTQQLGLPLYSVSQSTRCPPRLPERSC